MKDGQDYQHQAQRLVDPSDRALVVERHAARGRSSGVEASHELAHLPTARDSKISRWRQEALSAASPNG